MPTKKKKVELVGASGEPVRISGKHQIVASVQMDEQARGKVSASLSAAGPEAAIASDRVFLNLENIRGIHDATAFKVYVNDRLAGTIALFGVRKATVGEHAGQGITHVLEITKIADELNLKNELDVDALDVRIVPVKPVPDEAQVTIGRISIFRQGQ